MVPYLCNISQPAVLIWREVIIIPFNSQARDLPLFGCPAAYATYLNLISDSEDRLLHPKPETAPCSNDMEST
jgi:hypothetical protein